MQTYVNTTTFPAYAARFASAKPCSHRLDANRELGRVVVLPGRHAR